MARDRESEMIEELLWKIAKEQKWDEVVNKYDDKVTVLGETPLHMAITDGQEDKVDELLKKINLMETLQKKNTLGNTALHLAAHLGSVRICGSIVERSKELLGEADETPALLAARNKADETPLFVAAKHGRKEAFLYMHGLMSETEIEKDEYWKTDRRTVLHAAITGEHFDLAYQIIHLLPRLVNRFDKWDFLPLHLLARKPLIFKSGCPPMGRLYRLVYFCIHVKKLEDETKSNNSSGVHKKVDEENPPNPAGGVHEKVDEENPPNSGAEGPCPGLVPQNSGRRFRCLTLFSKAMDAILWLGSIQIENVIEQKKKHTWSVQIMDALLDRSKGHSYPKPKKDAKEKDELDIATGDGKDEAGTENKINKLIELVGKMNETFDRKFNIDDKKKKEKTVGKVNVLKESPLLMAAKNGILEMVEKILEKHPTAIHDVNLDEKNIVLAAVENRQPHIYQFLVDHMKILHNTIFYKTDKDGNSALHLAANVSDERNWDIPGPAMHMQWEVKWYQFVEKSMPAMFFVKYNENGETSWNVFRDTHKDLVVEAGQWLNTTSNSCSVVSTLIATVAFAAYATVPGGINSNTGYPVLERNAVFNLFAISSLVALCCSVASVIMFLVFFTSKYREIDFARNLPTKVLVELSTLMVAVAALLVSFCAAHSFVIKDSLKYTAFPLYAATLLPVAVYAFWQVPQYFEMAYKTFHHAPQRIYSQ